MPSAREIFDDWKLEILPSPCQVCNQAQIVFMRGGAKSDCLRYATDRDRSRCFLSRL